MGYNRDITIGSHDKSKGVLMATSGQRRQEIAAGVWDGVLQNLYGPSEETLARQRARWCAALEGFELYFGPGRQVRIYTAPGRAELGGNHTDHQHGYGLAAAVVWPKASARPGGR